MYIAAPRWRADCREIYFLAPDAMMMAVPVAASGSTFEAGTALHHRVACQK